MEFEWDPEHLSDEPLLEGPSIPLTILMVKNVISKKKFSKASAECYNVLSPFFELFKCHIPLEPE